MSWAYRHTVLGLATLSFVASMVARITISPVVPFITDDFGVSNGTIGIVLTGMWGMYALMQLPSGLLGDRFGERRVLLFAVGMTAAGSVLLGAAPGLLAFSIFALVIGTAAGFQFTVATTLLDKQFDNVGRVMGILLMGGPIAGLLAPPIAAVIGTRYGWRPAALLGAAVAIPTFLLLLRVLRPTDPVQPDARLRDRLDPGTLFELISRPSIAFTSVVAVIGAFAWQAAASFLPAFLTAAGGLQSSIAGLLFSLAFVVHGVTQPAVGWLSDHIGQEFAASVPFGAGVVGFTTLVTTTTFGGYVAGVVLVGLSMSWGAPIQARFLDSLATDEKGIGYGLIRTVHMILGASGSAVIGMLSDIAGWTVAFGALGGIVLVGLVFLLTNELLTLGY